MALAHLSERGRKGLEPALSYLELVLSAGADRYAPETNESGFIVLAVAENVLAYESLLRPRIVAALAALAASKAGEEPPGPGGGVTPFYDDMKGHPSLRKAVCNFMDSRFMGGQAAPGDFKFDWNNLLVTAGCGAVLELLAWSLCEPGDACVIPAPYYPAFDNDLTLRAGLVLFPADQGPEGQLLESSLQAAVDRARASGNRPRMLLVTNPQNPLGTNYSQAELETAIRFARANDMHLVCDEVYACSGHSPHAGAPPFTSIARVALGERAPQGKLGSDIHIVYGVSKDLTLSGYRAGFCYSEHAELQQALHNFGYFHCVSAPGQEILFELFSDATWMDRYLLQNNDFLANACSRFTAWCERLRVPFVRPASGIFLVVDLAGLLESPGDWAGERALFERMATNAKVLMTPGRDCHFSRPGFFRVCFAAVPSKALEAALTRLEAFVLQSRANLKRQTASAPDGESMAKQSCSRGAVQSFSRE